MTERKVSQDKQRHRLLEGEGTFLMARTATVKGSWLEKREGRLHDWGEKPDLEKWNSTKWT